MACWAVALMVGFAMTQWGLGSHLNVPKGTSGFWADLYMSGTTLFTLGIGDVTPNGAFARALTVVEAGVGFGFLALVIGYLPVLYQGFSRREVNISLLDARAGSPPSAGELLLRHVDDMAGLDALLRDWERWAAELMESHLSYPVLLYFRSQHEHQSWLGALTAILDASALVMVGINGGPSRQAQLTFAMARHAVVDLAQASGVAPRAPSPDRLPPDDLRSLRSLPGSTRRRPERRPHGRHHPGHPARPLRALRGAAWPRGCVSPCRRGARRRTRSIAGAPAPGNRERRESPGCRGRTWEIIRSSNWQSSSWAKLSGWRDVRASANFGSQTSRRATVRRWYPTPRR